MTQPPQTRLSVDLAPRVAAAFRALITHRGITATEGIRRAGSAWAFIEKELNAGHKFAVIETVDGTEQIREVTFHLGEQS